MKFRELSYVVTVADCLSITKAAQKLYISQPSLSHTISKIEEEMGAKLFDRTSYPIRLTYAGERYVETARQILRLADNLKREFTDISNGATGRVVIGMPTERMGYMLPRIFPAFKKEFPGIEIRTIEGKYEMLLEAVLTGEANFVIVPLWHNVEETTSELTSELIYKEELIFVADPSMVPEEARIAGRTDCVDLSKLQDIPYVLVRKGHAVRTTTDSLFRSAHISPKKIMETDSTLTAFNLAMSGAAAALVPRRTVEMANPLNQFQCYHIGEDGCYWNVAAIYRKDAYLDHAARRFIEIAKERFTQ